MTRVLGQHNIYKIQQIITTPKHTVIVSALRKLSPKPHIVQRNLAGVSAWRTKGGRFRTKNEKDTGSRFSSLSTWTISGGILAVIIARLVQDQECLADSDERLREGDIPISLEKRPDVNNVIQASRNAITLKMIECGCPGLSITVTVDGKTVWTEGFGYADLENNVPCKPETIFRIASISKSITMTAVAKLYENGDLDLDKPVQFYVPEFPEKYVQGEKVVLTIRHLLSHLGGIRHYDKDYMTEKKGDAKTVKDEMKLDEYYIKDHFDSVQDSLKLFKDDPLLHKPGTKYLYTTHGFTLISAVVEKAAKQPFEKYMQTILQELGLGNTYLEEHGPLLPNRGRHYVKNKQGKVENAPYVDLSYKWAGGGLISNVLDIVKFGNAMLYCFQSESKTPQTANQDKDAKKEVKQTRQSTKGVPIASRTQIEHQNQTSVKECRDDFLLPGYLKSETVREMWTKVDKTELSWSGIPGGGYGLAWAVRPPVANHAYCLSRPYIVSHTGGAIGASSVLLILPSADYNGELDLRADVGKTRPPKGVVVAMITNMISVGLEKTAYEIAQEFENLKKL